MKQVYLILVSFFAVLNLTFSQLLITEISYNPPESGTDSLEYIEIYNAGTTDINLLKYKFTAGVELTFPDVVLEKNKYLVLTVNDTAFFRVYGKPSLQWKTGGLNNNGEKITIVDSLNNVAVTLDYSDMPPWPTKEDGTDENGKSIELCDLTKDLKDGSNWNVSATNLGIQINGKTLFGTPGATNSAACEDEPDVIVEVSSNKFTPQDITIEIGQTVRWVNKGGSHNVNGSLATFATNPEGFTNGTASGALWTYDFTFTKPGLYNYQCDPHAAFGMVGTVTVKPEVVIDLFPLRSIAALKKVNTDGVADSLGINCTLRGIVHGVNYRTTGLQFFILDSQNKGMATFSNSNSFNYTVKEGDLVEVKGKLEQFRGLIQIRLEDVKKIDENQTLVAPKVVNALNDDDESSLVMIEKVSFKDDAEWTGGGTTFNVVMTKDNTEFVVRVINTTDAASKPLPNGSLFNVIGLLTQFTQQQQQPFSGGFQILPRYITDFIPISSANDTDLDKNMQIMPNPVSDVLTIKTQTLPDELNLFDMDGRHLNTVKNSLNIDMSGLKAGSYLIKVSKGGKYNVLRVIKM